MLPPSGTGTQVSAIAGLISGGNEAPPEKEEVDTVEVPEQATSGENLEADEAEAGGEATDTEAEQTAESGAAPGEIQTVVEFAKAAGWSPEELYDLKLNLDNGESLRLGEVKDKLQSYARQEADLVAKREELAQEQQALRLQVQQAMQGQNQLSAAVLEKHGEMQAIQAEFNSIDWEALGARDPGRAALLQQQIATKYAGAKAAFEDAQRQDAGLKQQYWNNALVESDKLFLRAVPEWKDQAVVAKEGPAIGQFLTQVMGFSPAELSTIIDPRARVIARMAWLYTQQQANVANATGKIRNAPKPVMKAGGGVRTATGDLKLNGLLQRAKTTGKKEDQISAISALLF